MQSTSTRTMILLLVILVGVFWCAHKHWVRLENEESPWQRLFWKWATQGLVLPILVWAGINLGFNDWFPGFVPTPQEAFANDADWFSLWIAAIVSGAVLIGLYWAALTYIWIVSIIARRAPRAQFASAAGLIGAILFLLSTPLLVFGGWHHLGTVAVLCLLPIAHMTIDLAYQPVEAPVSGVSAAGMKFGEYQEAEWALVEELEKNERRSPQQGKEPEEQRQPETLGLPTVREDLAVSLPLAPSTIIDGIIEANRLVDRLTEDRNDIQARERLARVLAEKIGRADLAVNQLNMLINVAHPTEEQKVKWLAQIASWKLRSNNSLMIAAGVAEANHLADRLAEHPGDTQARERLAVALAEKIGKADLGIEQLNLLINMAGVTDEQKAKWLAKIATWELALKNDEKRFRAVLSRIVDEYPTTAQAFAAQGQLHLLETGPEEAARRTG